MVTVPPRLHWPGWLPETSSSDARRESPPLRPERTALVPLESRATDRLALTHRLIRASARGRSGREGPRRGLRHVKSRRRGCVRERDSPQRRRGRRAERGRRPAGSRGRAGRERGYASRRRPRPSLAVHSASKPGPLSGDPGAFPRTRHEARGAPFRVRRGESSPARRRPAPRERGRSECAELPQDVRGGRAVRWIRGEERDGERLEIFRQVLYEGRWRLGRVGGFSGQTPEPPIVPAGGPAGTRTRDLRIKSPQLYRLSYRPVCLAIPSTY
jgi:hypothetical protein